MAKVNENVAHTIYSLYDGKVTVKFYPGNHQYFVDGKKVPSVSTILGVLGKPQLLYWAVNCAIDSLKAALNNGETIDESHLEVAKGAHNAVKQDAADTGSQVHRWVEFYLKHDNPAHPTDPEAIKAIKAFLQWEEAHKVEWVELEKVVYSRKHNYVGRFDALARVDGQLCFIDFKTSKGIYDEYWYQIAAYRSAFEEEHGKLEAKNLVLRFDKITGDPHAEFAQYPEDDLDVFLACLRIKQRELKK